jgi:hypothetical protein
MVPSIAPGHPWTVIWKDLSTDSLHFTHETAFGNPDDLWEYFNCMVSMRHICLVAALLPGHHHLIIKS